MKRPGKTKTLTISITAEAARFAKREARRRCAGNVSQFLGVLLSEAERLAAMDRVLASSGHCRLTAAELDELRGEAYGRPRRRRKRAA